jgi:hypothetical protein
METIEAYLKAKWYWFLAGLLVVILLVSYLNTPHQDSTEKPMSRQAEKELIRQRDAALKLAKQQEAKADSAAKHSQVAYEQGVEAGEEAMKARLETHQPPKAHAKTLPTPAATKHLQQYFDEY